STWQEVFQAAVLTHLQDQLTESLQSALDQVQQAEAAFFQAQEALAAFDWEHGLSVRPSPPGPFGAGADLLGEPPPGPGPGPPPRGAGPPPLPDRGPGPRT